MDKIIIGIDYSMTSPGLAIFQGNNHHLYAFCDSRVETNKVSGSGLQVRVFENAGKKIYKSQIERFDILARKMLVIINNYDLGNNEVQVYIEGYSMGSKGQVFHIAENTAILKHYLYRCDIPYIEIAPTEIKKYATGSGRAMKDDMYESFVNETGLQLKDHLTPNRKLGSPVTDLVDSFWIAKYGLEKEKQANEHETGQQSGETELI